MAVLNSFPVAILAGLVFGFLASAGVGGGSLLMLWLIQVTSTPQEDARAINLLFFVTAAGTVSLFRLRRKKFSLKQIAPAIVAGCIATALFTWIGSWLSTQLLRRLLGGLFVLTGLRELFYRPRNAK